MGSRTVQSMVPHRAQSCRAQESLLSALQYPRAAVPAQGKTNAHSSQAGNTGAVSLGSCAHSSTALADGRNPTRSAPRSEGTSPPRLPPPTFASQQKATSLAEQICLPSKQPDVSK